ncbi:metallopeptidase TldD-related protein [Clostridium scatologenes]|uniref:Peptidase U62 modulator of DNA gyrase n=1 Tax=Clostridium scatologenes TaxID=1548 RepID=A0A0E3JN05_CLOSL|nr:metallopeptidase TldD-related protein [Clostridium scatologenes]AKA68729.1 peptidase U62 modulator of DNA gyrase [Clostridium scatologenes]
MINRIKSILETLDVDGYKIVETKVNSEELFFIKKDLDMNRSKDVHHFKVTVYKDFEEKKIKYKGSSIVNIHPTMSDEEIKKSLEGAAFAANFAKNQYYDLPKKAIKENEKIKESSFKGNTLSYWMEKLTEKLYEADNKERGNINSSELFLEKVYKRIINSNGVDVSFENYKGTIEFITNWREKEEIELYKSIGFSNFDEKQIVSSVNEMLFVSQQRALAKDMPKAGKYKVIFTGSAVKELLSYYVYQGNVEAVYNHMSIARLNENIQGDDVKGDLLSITLDPALENSSYSVPFDEDGIALSKVEIFDKGLLKNYHGYFRHSFYLGVEPTGIINNFIVDGGSKAYKEMKNQPYMELVEFSDFQIDKLTGDFGGEIRLGWYFDGTKTTPITGGSVSGNMKDFHSNMYLSKEIQKDNEFQGPKALELFDVSIAGK